jgi:DNA-directed RNA polymerase specialized sigma subunit
MNYKTLNEVEKNQLVEQYEPLMNKLVAQFINDNVKCSWEDLKSYAYEGFALAIQKYDETRSSMNFTQYAAYYIRNNILLSLNNELRTVKLSAYA